MDKPKEEEYISLQMDHFIADFFSIIALNAQMGSTSQTALNILEPSNRTSFIIRGKKKVKLILLKGNMRKGIELWESYLGFQMAKIIPMKDNLIQIINFTARALSSNLLEHTKGAFWMESRMNLEYINLLIIFDMRENIKRA